MQRTGSLHERNIIGFALTSGALVTDRVTPSAAHPLNIMKLSSQNQPRTPNARAFGVVDWSEEDLRVAKKWFSVRPAPFAKTNNSPLEASRPKLKMTSPTSHEMGLATVLSPSSTVSVYVPEPDCRCFEIAPTFCTKHNTFILITLAENQYWHIGKVENSKSLKKCTVFLLYVIHSAKSFFC